MTEAEQKMWNFEVSLKEVISKLEQLRTENQDLTKKNKALEAELKDQKNLTKDLEENNKNVKLAVTMSQSMGDQEVLKEQIEGYIKEIDRCIALLSD